MRTAAIVVAAGSGSRAGLAGPKQFELVRGRPMIAHAVDALRRHPGIDVVQLVVGEEQGPLCAALLPSPHLPPPVVGGAERRDSVLAGLAAVDAERVLIHDAARPFLPAAVIDRVLAALDDAPGAVPVLPVVDTLARGDAALGETIARDGLWRVQTPQGFHADVLRAAHASWTGGPATDDAQVLRAAGHEVRLVAGDRRLEKMTLPEDFAALAVPDIRTGSGYDVHALVPGDHVWLCGVRVPHDRALSGHSDADVGLHALTDALLGAIGDGDIGHHFPPSDPQWRGAASHLFLTHAADLVAARGGRVLNVDVTLVCEAPKVGPHRAAMRAELARMLGLAADRVSVKATTTERLGFTGRGEGIAAQAVATVVLEG